MEHVLSIHLCLISQALVAINISRCQCCPLFNAISTTLEATTYNEKKQEDCWEDH